MNVVITTVPGDRWVYEYTGSDGAAEAVELVRNQIPSEAIRVRPMGEGGQGQPTRHSMMRFTVDHVVTISALIET